MNSALDVFGPDAEFFDMGDGFTMVKRKLASERIGWALISVCDGVLQTWKFGVALVTEEAHRQAVLEKDTVMCRRLNHA
jgi:hypothetical protein